MPKMVKAKPGSGSSVVYIDEAGREYVVSAGHRNWRNNNPGNLRPGNVSKRNGAIGVAGGFAVFPDPESGWVALRDSLRNVHGDKTIAQMIRVYAPKSENDPDKYLRFLRDQTGIHDERKIRELSPAEFERLVQAINRMEGGRPGKAPRSLLQPLGQAKGQIIQVRKNKKGTITGYLIEGYGWVSKARGIELAQAGRIDAVVATSSAGNLFLRSRPSSEIENLEDLG